jgi:uncharacterized protein YutE (UPF0331/DUF86 family)
MENDVVLKKIDALGHCISRIETKCPDTAEKLKQDYDLQDIISANLERAVQLSVDISAHILAERGRRAPDTMGETFSSLAEQDIIPQDLAERLKKAVGFRNISVHEYEKIDWDIVYSIASKHIDDFRSFIRHIKDA